MVAPQAGITTTCLCGGLKLEELDLHRTFLPDFHPDRMHLQWMCEEKAEDGSGRDSSVALPSFGCSAKKAISRKGFVSESIAR